MCAFLFLCLVWKAKNNVLRFMCVGFIVLIIGKTELKYVFLWCVCACGCGWAWYLINSFCLGFFFLRNIVIYAVVISSLGLVLFLFPFLFFLLTFSVTEVCISHVYHKCNINYTGTCTVNDIPTAQHAATKLTKIKISSLPPPCVIIINNEWKGCWLLDEFVPIRERWLLRFLMLFMGVMSATYSITDVYDDLIKRKVGVSFGPLVVACFFLSPPNAWQKQMSYWLAWTVFLCFIFFNRWKLFVLPKQECNPIEGDEVREREREENEESVFFF